MAGRVRLVSDQSDPRGSVATQTTMQNRIAVVHRQMLTTPDQRRTEFASWGSPVRARHAPPLESPANVGFRLQGR